MARWPCLVLPQFCTTDIQIVVESEEIGENGAPVKLINWVGKCNYQESAKRVYVTGKVYVEVSATCLIPGDIAPTVAVIPSGKVNVLGVERLLVLGTKVRNPDGSVNYTKLELK